MKSIKKIIKTFLLRAGYQVLPVDQTYEHSKNCLIARNGIDMVLDVGANVGQFATRLRLNGYHGKIVSFEPDTQAFEKFQKNFEMDSNIFAHQTAFSDHNGELEFLVAADSACSGFNTPTSEMTKLLPDAKVIDKRVLKVQRLDDYALSNSIQGTNIFLKIDVQGHEQKVLDGATGILARCSLIELEIPVLNSYEGSATISETLKIMSERGYELVSVGLGYFSPTSGQLADIDCLFKRVVNNV